MRTPARLLALGLVLLVLGTAMAQAPSASPSVSIEGPTEGKASIQAARTFTFTVKNNGQSTPLDQQNQGTVTIAVGGVPEGWTASANPPAFKLAPGASATVELQVSVAPEAEAKSADVTVTATMVSPLGGLDPILGQVPGGTQTSQAQVSIHLTSSDTVTRDLLEAVGPWIYLILLLLIAAVIVAVAITIASRRSVVRLSSDSRDLPVAAGSRVAFPFRAEGLAKDQDTVLLQVSAVQEGWAAFLPVPELVLDPGQTQELSLIVIAPKDATPGSRQVVLVTAASAKAPKGASHLEFVATVEGAVAGASRAPVEAPRRRKET